MTKIFYCLLVFATKDSKFCLAAQQFVPVLPDSLKVILWLGPQCTSSWHKRLLMWKGPRNGTTMLLYLCGFSAVPYKADRKVRAGQYNKLEVRVIGAGLEL